MDAFFQADIDYHNRMIAAANDRIKIEKAKIRKHKAWIRRLNRRFKNGLRN